MTVSDSSPYWIVDQMIWNALEDTTLTNGLALDSWRKQQNPKGNAGRNYKTGNFPEDISELDTPALIFRPYTITPQEQVEGSGSMARIYPVLIEGAISTPAHMEATGDKLAKRFQHLVEYTIGEARSQLTVANSPYLPQGESIYIDDIRPGDVLEFPDLTEPDTLPGFLFSIDVRILLDCWRF